jgi:hypothetical protein
VDRQPNHCLYLNIDDGLRASFGAACVIELEYRNTGSGQILLHYDSLEETLPDHQGAYKQHLNVVRRKNTGQWLTAQFPISDAKFQNRQNAGADFRFVNVGDALLIRSVRVTFGMGNLRRR